MRQMALLLMVGLVVTAAFGQGPYRTVTIRDIQFVPFDSLRIADSLQNTIPSRWTLQASQFVKVPVETVDVVGQVIVPPKVITYARAGYIIVLRDTGAIQPDWSSLLVFPNLPADTLGLLNNGFLNIERGDIIKIRGYVTEFPPNLMNSTTQLTPVAAPIEILDSRPVPAPARVSVDQFYLGLYPGKVRFTTGEPLEGAYVELTGLTAVSVLNQTNGTFTMIDENGNSISTYDASKWFTTRGHRDPSSTYALPSFPTRVDTIRGYITTVSGGENDRGYRITPVFRGDIVFGQTLPALTTHRREPVIVSSTDTAKISVRSYRQPGGFGIASVLLHSSINGAPWSSDTMKTVANDSTYRGLIVPQPVGSFVKYFITAVDSNGNVATLASSGTGGSAADTSKGTFFYRVTDRPLTIYDIQYTPFTNGRTAYLGAVTSVSGIVTVDTSEMYQAPLTTGGTNAWYMQTSDQPWNGIWITGPDSVLASLQKGDSVTVTGTIQENFDVTRIGNSTAVVKHASNRPVPPPVVLTTGTFGPSVGNGTPGAEQWEGMLVRFNNVVVSNINPTFADPTEYEIDDGSGPIIVRRDGRNRYSNVPGDTVIGKSIIRQYYGFSYVQGIMYYSFNRYKVTPRGDADFGVLTSVFPSDRPFVAGAFVLEQNYPNPFNPSTTIDYNVPMAGNVKVEVFNILGQHVHTLVNEYHTPGRYQVRFDASRLPSGVYFYRLSAENVSQVKRMVFLK